jgi:hypothetical protein
LRALILALAIGGAAGAQDNASPNGELRLDAPAPREPGGVRRQAENTIRQGLADPAGVEFRREGVTQATSVKHGDFGERIAGPVSVVCGQYNSRDQTGGFRGFAWFFVAIKHGQVLWADVDGGADDPGAAYYGCKGAGLAS